MNVSAYPSCPSLRPAHLFHPLQHASPDVHLPAVAEDDVASPAVEAVAKGNLRRRHPRSHPVSHADHLVPYLHLVCSYKCAVLLFPPKNGTFYFSGTWPRTRAQFKPPKKVRSATTLLHYYSPAFILSVYVLQVQETFLGGPV